GGPVLEVPDGRGGWRTGIPSMGYPAGKTKTVPVDLSRILDRRDPRVRIRTNLEISWDRIVYTVDEDRALLRETAAPLVSADLFFRGFSRVTKETAGGPPVFVHDDAEAAPPCAGWAARGGAAGAALTPGAAPDETPPPPGDAGFVVKRPGDGVGLPFDA